GYDASPPRQSRQWRFTRDTPRNPVSHHKPCRGEACLARVGAHTYATRRPAKRVPGICIRAQSVYPAGMAAARKPSIGVQPGLDGVSRENRALRELVTIYHHLTGLALQSAEVQAVVELLAERMACQVAVVSPTLELLAA